MNVGLFQQHRFHFSAFQNFGSFYHTLRVTFVILPLSKERLPPMLWIGYQSPIAYNKHPTSKKRLLPSKGNAFLIIIILFYIPIIWVKLALKTLQTWLFEGKPELSISLDGVFQQNYFLPGEKKSDSKALSS